MSLFDDPINSVYGNKSFLKKYNRLPNKSDSEELRIVTHLNFAYNTILNKYKNNITEKRKIILNHLSEYISSRVFPINNEFQERRSIFIDNEGRLCAVGYLIAKTAGLDKAQIIDKLYHDEIVKNMDIRKIPFVESWCCEYGLDLDDLALIQPGYDGILTVSPLFLVGSWLFIITSLGFIIYSWWLLSVLVNPLAGTILILQILIISSIIMLVIESLCYFGIIYDTFRKKYEYKGLFHKIVGVSQIAYVLTLFSTFYYGYKNSLLTDIIPSKVYLILTLIYFTITIFLFGVITFLLIGCWDAAPMNFKKLEENEENYHEGKEGKEGKNPKEKLVNSTAKAK